MEKQQAEEICLGQETRGIDIRPVEMLCASFRSLMADWSSCDQLQLSSETDALHLTLQRKRPLICLQTNFLSPLSSHGSSRLSTNLWWVGLGCDVPFQQMNIKIKLCTSTKLKNHGEATHRRGTLDFVYKTISGKTGYFWIDVLSHHAWGKKLLSSKKESDKYSYTVGVRVCCWQRCSRLPQSAAGAERCCPWLTSAWLKSSSHPPSQWSPADSPGQRWPSWPVYSVSSCLCRAAAFPADHCVKERWCHPTVIYCSK